LSRTENGFEISVVVPCLNEQASVRAVVERLLAAADEARIPVEVVVVDDGSTDATAAVAEEIAGEHPRRVRLVRHERTAGIAAGWASGTDAARGAYICFIDGDLQYQPEQVITLFEQLLASRADLAQGVRSKIGRVREPRYLYSRVLNIVLNLLFGIRAADNKSGFILGPAPVVRDVLDYRGRYRYFQTFIRVAAEAKGYTFVEVETVFASRRAGSSFISSHPVRLILAALLDLPPAVWEFRLRRRRSVRSPVPTAGPTVRSARHPYRGWRRVRFELYFGTMPLHKWLISRRARGFYLQLKQTEWLSRDELRELQSHKLRRMLQHAYVHVPYYRARMDALGLKPFDLHVPEDLAKFPLLSKDDMRRHLYFTLFADTHRKREMLPITTSGSTGEPFTTYADRFQLEMRFATTLRALEWTGWRFGDRQVRLWHQTIGMSKSQIVRERIDALFMKRLFIPAFEIGADNIDELLRSIADHRPSLLDGYAESLNLLARYLDRAEIELKVPAVVSSAQELSEQTRGAIKRALSTRVYDKYGAREFSGIAYECGHGSGHHVMAESYVVELLVDGRPAEPGEIGEVVITDLNNFSVPLIRYRIGDLATAVDESEPCPCGRSFPRLGRIEGRTQAIVHCANGTWIPGSLFLHLFKDYDYLIRMFQIHQHEVGRLELRVVKGDQYSHEGMEALLGELRRFIGDTVVELQFVDEIPLVRTGKRSPIVSTVAVDFQQLGARGTNGIAIRGESGMEMQSPAGRDV
jgi:phenylacetate-coenzyme A ligase PaaK-like adenylate-forming protein